MRILSTSSHRPVVASLFYCTLLCIAILLMAGCGNRVSTADASSTSVTNGTATYQRNTEPAVQVVEPDVSTQSRSLAVLQATPTQPPARTSTTGASATGASTQTSVFGTVNAAVVNIHSTPSRSSNVVAQVTEGTQVQIIESSRDQRWLRICCVRLTNGDNAEVAQTQTWVEIEFISINTQPTVQAQARTQTASANTAPANTAPANTAPANTAPSQPTQPTTPPVVATIQGTVVNVRSGPDTTYPVVSQVRAGQTFDVIGRNDEGTWWQLCCPVTGSNDTWVIDDFMTLSTSRTQALQSIPPGSSTVAPRQAARPPASNAASPVPDPTLPRPSANTAPANTAPANTAPANTAPVSSSGGALNQLTGLPLDSHRIAQRPIIVCINNDYASRPQFGTSQADIMYEYLMEGRGITRFSGIYYGSDSSQIGPVRSARLINFYMGGLYDAGLLCSGASDGVRFKLKHEVLFPYLDIDLDDPSNTRYSTNIGSDYRTRLRTDTTKMRRWLQNWGEERSPNLNGLRFGALPSGGASGNSINIPYPRGTGSQVSYQYSSSRGAYLRTMGGIAHVDGNTGVQIAADNVVIQVVRHEVTDIIEDSLGSRSIRLNLFGSGQAYVFRDGQSFVGTWRTSGPNDPPKFYDQRGNLIPLKPGRTWISVVPVDYRISYQ